MRGGQVQGSNWCPLGVPHGTVPPVPLGVGRGGARSPASPAGRCRVVSPVLTVDSGWDRGDSHAGTHTCSCQVGAWLHARSIVLLPFRSPMVGWVPAVRTCACALVWAVVRPALSGMVDLLQFQRRLLSSAVKDRTLATDKALRRNEEDIRGDAAGHARSHCLVVCATVLHPQRVALVLAAASAAERVGVCNECTWGVATVGCGECCSRRCPCVFVRFRVA